MKEYTFVIETKIPMATTVKAETLEDAVEIAKDRSANLYGDRQKEWTVGGELDWFPLESACELVDLDVKDNYPEGQKLFPVACELWEK